MKPLFPYQAAAIAELRQSYLDGHKRPVLQLPTGGGKTRIAAEIINSALERGKRVTFTVPALSLIDQTIEHFWAEGIRDIGVMQADHRMTAGRRPVQVASVQTLARRKFPDTDLVIVDECFAARTIIETEHAPRFIEDIKVGDLVRNATGFGYVERVIRSIKAACLTVRLSNGEQLRTTPDHPFFTANGWTPAGQLEVGSLLFSPEAMRRLWDNHQTEVSERRAGGGAQIQKAAVLLRILREEAREPYVQARKSREDGFDSSEDWAQTRHSRWQRKIVDAATTRSFECSVDRLESGTYSGDGGISSTGIRQTLQDRHSPPRPDDRDRSRWSEPQRQAQASRREEGPPFGDVWVVDISSDKQPSIEFVYNLRVAGHPSYFAGGVLVHNCHRGHAVIYKWMTEKPELLFCGLSATPWTKGMGKYYDDLIIVSTTKALIDAGRLSPFEVYAPSHPDLSGVKTVAGDYHEQQLSEAVNTSGLVADIVKTWQEKAENRPTLVFAVDRAHAKHLQERFQAAGVAAGYQDMDTSREERETIRRAFRAGIMPVVCNVGTLTTGVDWDVRCIVLARPTKSEILFTQIVGRGLRTAEGKADCLILDHADNHLRLGFVTDIHHTELDDGKPKKAKERHAALPKECPRCHYLRPPRQMTQPCPQCGHVLIKPSPGAGWATREKQERDGTLHRFTGQRQPALVRVNGTLIDRADLYRELQLYAEEKGWRRQFADVAYKEATGVWPERARPSLVTTVSPAIVRWLKARQIAYHRRRKAG